MTAKCSISFETSLDPRIGISQTFCPLMTDSTYSAVEVNTPSARVVVTFAP